jgi:hypothetical protein
MTSSSCFLACSVLWAVYGGARVAAICRTLISFIETFSFSDRREKWIRLASLRDATTTTDEQLFISDFIPEFTLILVTRESLQEQNIWVGLKRTSEIMADLPKGDSLSLS